MIGMFQIIDPAVLRPGILLHIRKKQYLMYISWETLFGMAWMNKHVELGMKKLLSYISITYLGRMYVVVDSRFKIYFIISTQEKI